MTEVNKYIAKAFQKYGYTVNVNDNNVEFSPLSLSITGVLDHIDESNNEQYHARLIIKTGHKIFFPSGIKEYAYGWGSNPEEAKVNAAYRWIESDFTVFHDLLCESNKDNDESHKMELLSISNGIDGNSEILGWEIVFGDLMYSDTESKLSLERNEIFLKIFDLATSTLLDKKGAYGMKVFMIQREDDSLQMDFRVNGNNWEEGKIELEKYVSTWNIFDKIHWRKQYMLLVNKNLNDLKNKEILLQELSKALEK